MKENIMQSANNKPKVVLLHYTPIEILDISLTKCWGSDCKTGDAMMERIDRIINKNKHGSIAEHCSVNLDVIGVSRALLQEVARHRMASISVKSTRYTLKELKDEEPFVVNKGHYNEYNINRAKKYIVLPPHAKAYDKVWQCQVKQLDMLRELIVDGTDSNDINKYCMVESYKTDFTWTLNIRSLMNLFDLRTDKSALWEFRLLAHEIFKVLPEPYKYLLKGYVKDESN